LFVPSNVVAAWPFLDAVEVSARHHDVVGAAGLGLGDHVAAGALLDAARTIAPVRFVPA